MIFNTAGSSAFRCSGEYKIQAKGGALTDWTDVSQVITAPTTGSILSDADNDPQTIDENILIPGQTYSFRMVDDNNSIKSQLVNITIPINAVIQSYTAGTSIIDFTNNGGDDWTVGFKIAVSDLPSGYNVVSYDYDVNFIVGGFNTHIDEGNKTADYDANTSGNGAGVYHISCTYNISDGVTNLSFYMRHLIKVDNSGNVLGAIKNNGVIVNSVNGLTIDYTAFLTQIGVSGQINVDAVDGTTYDLTNLSHNLNDTVTLPIGTGGFVVYAEIDPTFWSDLGGLLGNTLATCNIYFTIIS